MHPSRILCVLTAALALLAAQPARADDTQVRKCVQTLGDQAIATVKNAGLSKDARRQQLENLIRQGADLEWMGRFVLGVQWRRANDAQRAQYLDLYQRLLLKNYTARFEEYTGSTFAILAVDGAGRPGEYMVRTQISQTGGQPPIMVDYRVREAAAPNCKVFDIVVEGVSLIATQRSEYTSYAGQRGMDGLIAELQRRLAGPADTSLTGQGKK